MWNTLAQKADPASTSVGRQALFRAFTNLRPTPDVGIGEYLAQLLEIRNQIIGTEEAISDAMFRCHIFSVLPDVFDTTVRIVRAQPDLSIEEVIDAFKRDESYQLLRSTPAGATDASYANSGRRNKRRSNGGARYGATFASDLRITPRTATPSPTPENLRTTENDSIPTVMREVKPVAGIVQV